MLSTPLLVPNKSSLFPNGCFSDLFFKMLNDGKFTTFLSNMFQSTVSVLLVLLSFLLKHVVQPMQGEIQKVALSS